MSSKVQNLILNFLRHNDVVRNFVRLLERLFKEILGKRATDQVFCFQSVMQSFLFSVLEDNSTKSVEDSVDH